MVVTNVSNYLTDGEVGRLTAQFEESKIVTKLHDDSVNDGFCSQTWEIESVSRWVDGELVHDVTTVSWRLKCADGATMNDTFDAGESSEHDSVVEDILQGCPTAKITFESAGGFKNRSYVHPNRLD